MTDSETPLTQEPARSAIFPANFESLENVRAFVGDAARDGGLDTQAIYAVQLAVDEAFTNIVEHAYGGECQELIECICEINPDALIVTLCDCGKPFNPEAVPDPNLSASLEEREEGGLGLYFMRQLMDEVSFSFNQQAEGALRCNVLTMVKRK